MTTMNKVIEQYQDFIKSLDILAKDAHEAGDYTAAVQAIKEASTLVAVLAQLEVHQRLLAAPAAKPNLDIQ
jgi:hypothetical protein